MVEANDKSQHTLENSAEKYNEGRIDYSLNGKQKITLIERYYGGIEGDYKLVIRFLSDSL